MNRLTTSIILSCVWLFAEDARADDDAALRVPVQRLQEGWNTKNAELFASPFAEDADYVAINGLEIKGRAAIAAGHKRIFDTIYKESAIELTVQKIRKLSPAVAVVHASARNRFKRGAEHVELTMVLSMVLVKNAGGEWKIVSFQNTKIDPRGP